MITSLDQLDFQKTYSYADYLSWQFDEFVQTYKRQNNAYVCSYSCSSKNFNEFESNYEQLFTTK